MKSEFYKCFDSADKLEFIIYSSGEELFKEDSEDKIDVYFIDIECGNMNGFDIAKRIVSKKKNAGIVSESCKRNTRSETSDKERMA